MSETDSATAPSPESSHRSLAPLLLAAALGIVGGYAAAKLAELGTTHPTWISLWLLVSGMCAALLIPAIFASTLGEHPFWRPLAVAAALGGGTALLVAWRLFIEGSPTPGAPFIFAGETIPAELRGQIAFVAGTAVLLVPFLGRFTGQWRDEERAYPVLLMRYALMMLVVLFVAVVVYLAWVLAAALLNIVNVHFLERWRMEPTIVAAVLGGAATLAAGVLAQGTAMRPLQRLVFMVLAWLAVPLGFAILGFLALVLFIGLQAVWSTKQASLILSGVALAAMALAPAVLLVWQRGEFAKAASVIARLLGLAAPILAGLALYGIWLRIDQYGLMPDRLVAGALVLGLLLVALGYAAAALAPSRTMMRVLAIATVPGVLATAALAIALVLPPLDAARLSAEDQAQRLRDGRARIEQLGGRLFARDLGFYGRHAADRLINGNPGQMDVERFRTALRDANPPVGRGGADAAEREARLRAAIADWQQIGATLPAGAEVPASVLELAFRQSERERFWNFCARRIDEKPSCLIVRTTELEVGGRPMWIFAWADREPRNPGDGNPDENTLRVRFDLIEMVDGRPRYRNAHMTRHGGVRVSLWMDLLQNGFSFRPSNWRDFGYGSRWMTPYPDFTPN